MAATLTSVHCCEALVLQSIGKGDTERRVVAVDGQHTGYQQHGGGGMV